MGFFDYARDGFKAMGEVLTAPDLGQQISESWQAAKQRNAANTQIIVERAKSVIQEPLNKVIDATSSIIKKAAPAALAACASKEYSDVQASFASFLQPVHIRSKYILIGDNRHNTIGYALEKTRTLSALSGFTICQNAVVNYTGTQPTQEEIELIKGYLEAGFYIE